MKKANTAGQKFRFNFIDALLILIILAAAALLGYIFTSADVSLFGGSETVEIEYVIQARNVRSEFVEKINVGDKVTDTVTLYSIGEVVEKNDTEGSYVGINRQDGTVVNGPYPGHRNINITIRTTATVSDEAYDVNGYTVAVGKLIALRVPNLTCEGYCMSITEVSTNG